MAELMPKSIADAPTQRHMFGVCRQLNVHPSVSGVGTMLNKQQLVQGSATVTCIACSALTLCTALPLVCYRLTCAGRPSSRDAHARAEQGRARHAVPRPTQPLRSSQSGIVKGGSAPGGNGGEVGAAWLPPWLRCAHLPL
jgi:hypothetical protein